MAASKVQSASNTSILATVTATFSQAPRSGNLLVAAVTANVGTGSIAISGWTAANSIAVGVAGGLVVFYKVSAGTETSVTATATAAILMDLHIFEYAGIDNASPLDVVASTADGGSGVTARSSGTTATLTQANELAFVAVATAGNNGGLVSWSNSYTTEITTTDLMTADLVTTVTTATSSTATWTTSQRAAGIIVTFFGETGNTYGLKYPLKPLIPNINWNHPLTKGLFVAAPLFERGGTKIMEIVSKMPGTLSVATWITDLYGAAISYAGGASTGIITLGTFTPTPLRSILMTFLIKATDATARRFIQWDNGATGNDITEITSTNLIFNPNFSSTNGVFNVAVPSTNVWHTLIITYDSGSVSNVPIIYLDGIPQTVTTGTTPVGTANSVSGTMYIGNVVGLNRCFNGYIGSLFRWKRLLNTSEIKQLSANPWQIYTQPGLIKNQ